MIKYDAVENRVLEAYFWWAAITVPYYIAKYGIVSQRSEHAFLDTSKGKVVGYLACISAAFIFTLFVGESLQNRIGIFAIMLAPTVFGAYCGFETKKSTHKTKEDYVTEAQRKVKAYGKVIADSSVSICIPISELPHPVNEIKDAIQRMYLCSASDGEYRNSLVTAYLRLSDFVPDEQAKIVQAWHQRNAEDLTGEYELSRMNMSLREEVAHIMKEKHVQYKLLENEWDDWLQKAG